MSEVDASAAALHDVPVERAVTSTTERFHGRVWDIASDTVDLGDGRIVTRDYVRHTGAVVIMALNERGEVYLVRQYRHPVGAECWEPPAGLLDAAGESPLDAARRELFEEADLEAAVWHVLVDFHPSGGGSSESVRVFLARDLTPVPVHLRHERTDEERDMEGRWVPVDQLVEAVMAGAVHASSAVVGAMALTIVARDGGLEGPHSSLRPADSPWTRAPMRLRREG